MFVIEYSAVGVNGARACDREDGTFKTEKQAEKAMRAMPTTGIFIDGEPVTTITRWVIETK
jgi:hypothetical protein